MSEEIKREQPSVRSFRITDDVMTRFRELQDEMKLTQDGALKMLVDAYELEQAKNAIPDRETEIANFQTKASELVEAFIHSLQLNQDAEARIRNEVALKLESKDQTIADLQEKAKKKDEKLDELKTAVKEAQEKQILAEAEAENAKKAQASAEQQAADKAAIADMRLKELDETKAKLAEYPALKASEASLKESLGKALQDIKDAKKDAEMEKSQALADMERTKDKRIAELEVDLSKAQTSASEKAERIERLLKAEEKHEAAMDKLNEKLEKVRDERDALKGEVIDLKAQVKELQAQLAQKNQEFRLLNEKLEK